MNGRERDGDRDRDGVGDGVGVGAWLGRTRSTTVARLVHARGR
jgi:hypothetical protein